MKAATVQEIKLAINNASPKQMAELLVRLAKFKKENKELLTYLLFESFDETAYTENIKLEMTEQMADMNKANFYLVKKSLRKILRTVNKYIRYMGTDDAEVSLLLHFCKALQASGIQFQKNQVLLNIYNNQLKKIRKTVDGMHEDLQYEYLKILDELS